MTGLLVCMEFVHGCFLPSVELIFLIDSAYFWIVFGYQSVLCCQNVVIHLGLSVQAVTPFTFTIG